MRFAVEPATMFASFAVFALACGAAHTVRAQVPIDVLNTVDGTTPQTEWVGIDADGKFRFRPLRPGATAAASDVVVAKSRLVAWGRPAEAAVGKYLVLVDGGIVAINDATSGPESIRVETRKFGARNFPLERVRGIVFRAPSSARRRDRLFESVLSPGAGDRDRLTLIDGDELVGSLSSLAAGELVIETSLGPAEKHAAEASTLVLNPALAATPPLPSPRLLVGLADGTLLVCSNLSIAGDQVKLEPSIENGSPAKAPSAEKTPPGETAAPWNAARSDVVFLQTIGGDARYLSDIEPSGYKHVPFLDRVVEYRVDRSVGGGRLRAGGRRYEKGISMPSTSRLTFPLDATAKKFQAELAIDDDAEGGGSVTFRVFVDAEERFRSETVRGGDPPRRIEVDVAGGKQLSLVVDFAEFGDQLDYADWLNARLVP
jgi:hypothetical protein